MALLRKMTCNIRHPMSLCHPVQYYGVATVSRLPKIIGLICRISSLLSGSFAKETCNLKEPTNHSHLIVESLIPMQICIASKAFPCIQCCSVLQQSVTAECCRVLQCVAALCNTLQHSAALQCVAQVESAQPMCSIYSLRTVCNIPCALSIQNAHSLTSHMLLYSCRKLCNFPCALFIQNVHC